MADSKSNVKVPTVPSGYVSVAELRARSKQTKDSSISSISNSKNEIDKEVILTNPAAFPISIVSETSEECNYEKISDFNKEDTIQKSVQTPLVALRSGSDTAKRKSSDEGGYSVSTASRIVRESILYKKRFNIGQNVLLHLRSTHITDDTLECDAEISTVSTYVNEKGFPPNEGVTISERFGPYSYVISEVVKVHFDEDHIYYTVKRHDNETLVRADRGKSLS